jgi:hypothetical protein
MLYPHPQSTLFSVVEFQMTSGCFQMTAPLTADNLNATFHPSSFRLHPFFSGCFQIFQPLSPPET